MECRVASRCRSSSRWTGPPSWSAASAPSSSASTATAAASRAPASCTKWGGNWGSWRRGTSWRHSGMLPAPVTMGTDGRRMEMEKLIFLLCLDWYPKSLTSTRLELEFMGRWEELMLPSLPYGAVSPLVEWVIQEPKGWLLFMCQCAWAKYWILKCSLWAWKHVEWQQLPIGSVSVCVTGLIKGFVKHFGVPLRCWKHYISAI